MHVDRLDPAGEIAAKQADQFGDGEVEEGGLALRFKLGRPASRRNRLRSAAGRRAASDRSPVSVRSVRPKRRLSLSNSSASIERQEQLVGEPERQAGRGLDLRRGASA